jgi:hypothetical protein
MNVFAGAAEGMNGAENRNRTCDLLITNQLLYRLSYFGALNEGMILAAAV